MALGSNIQQDGDIFGNSSDNIDYMGSVATVRRRKRHKKIKHNSRRTHKRKSHRKYRKGNSRIKHTKNGQPYIIDKRTGRARFIKRR